MPRRSLLILTLIGSLLCLPLWAATPPAGGTETSPVPLGKAGQAPTGRIVPAPVPVTGANYPDYARPDGDEGATAMELGPVQRKYIFANQPDSQQVAGNPVITQIPNPIALDRHIRIPGIHEVHNDPRSKDTENHALSFELDYLNWGAITSRQVSARRGDYLIFTWDNHGPKQDFTTSFEYRQVGTKEVIRRLVGATVARSGATRAYFAVIGKAYTSYGPVSSWRFTVLRGDTVVAEAKSYIW